MTRDLFRRIDDACEYVNNPHIDLLNDLRDELVRLRNALRIIVDCEDANECLVIAARALLYVPPDVED